MQDEERRRIARELHDGLGQELVAAKMLFHRLVQPHTEEAKQQIGTEAVETIDRAIQQVRSMSHLLHPPLLDEVGLRSALRWYLEGFSQRCGIETSLDVQSDFPRLTPELETAMFRIVQEALSNVFRHSEAQRAWISLSLQDGRVAVTVRDNGRGIADRVAELQPGSIGIGIGGMRQRAKEFGGELRLASVDPGTLVEIVIPCTVPVTETAQVTA